MSDINKALKFAAQCEAYDRQRRQATGGLACPRCGTPEPSVTCIKGFFGGTSPAYECLKCGHKWKWS